MRVQQYDDAHAFFTAVEAHLLHAEAVNNLAYGISDGAVKGYGSVPSMMLAAFDGEEVVGAGVMTPPYNLILSQFEHPNAAGVLVEYCAAQNIPLPGIVGTREDTARFAEQWTARTGQVSRLYLPQRLYRLERVIPPQGVAGGFRQANEADLPMLAQWSIGFQEDALGTTMPLEQAQRIVAHFIDAATPYYFLIWEVDGIPTSTAAINRVMRHGVNVAFVYTPPEHRRKGYGAAVTAAVSQHALDSGWQFCTLYTDLTNPTTNHIYQTIGYVPVIDASDWRFE